MFRSKMKTNRTEEFVGMVVPSFNAENGVITELSLMTPSGEEFRILRSPKTFKMRHLAWTDVHVTGSLIDSQTHCKVLQVKTFRSLVAPPDDLGLNGATNPWEYQPHLNNTVGGVV